MPDTIHESTETQQESIRAFSHLVHTTSDPLAVEKWVSATAIRQNLFNDMVVGRIRWPRTLGRPQTPTLAEGFRIQSKVWIDIWHFGMDGSIIEDIQKWMPGEPVTTRDDFSEFDHYSVHYLFSSPQDGRSKSTSPTMEPALRDCDPLRRAHVLCPQIQSPQDAVVRALRLHETVFAIKLHRGRILLRRQEPSL